MKPATEIRRDNLRALVRQSGGVARFSERINRSPAQVSQWLNAAPDHKTGKPRAIGDKSARHIEQSIGLPHGWLDHQHQPPHAAPAAVSEPPVHYQPRNNGAPPHDLQATLDDLIESLANTPPEILDEVHRLIIRYLESDGSNRPNIVRAIVALVGTTDTSNQHDH